jgi:hypothetical protein
MEGKMRTPAVLLRLLSFLLISGLLGWHAYPEEGNDQEPEESDVSSRVDSHWQITCQGFGRASTGKPRAAQSLSPQVGKGESPQVGSRRPCARSRLGDGRRDKSGEKTNSCPYCSGGRYSSLRPSMAEARKDDYKTAGRTSERNQAARRESAASIRKTWKILQALNLSLNLFLSLPFFICGSVALRKQKRQNVVLTKRLRDDEDDVLEDDVELTEQQMHMEVQVKKTHVCLLTTVFGAQLVAAVDELTAGKDIAGALTRV